MSCRSAITEVSSVVVEAGKSRESESEPEMVHPPFGSQQHCAVSPAEDRAGQTWQE